MSAGTRRRRAPRQPDRLCAEAVGLARGAAEEVASPGTVGEWIESVADGDRVVTHLFECLEPGYRGWRWATTVARASRARVVTLDETVLLPGPDSLVAPEWLPWSERLRPGDLGPGDLLPTESDDLRLESGFSGEDTPPPNSAVVEEAEPSEVPSEVPSEEPSDEPSAERTAAAAEVTAEAVAEGKAAAAQPPTRARINAVAEELGMARARVLSRYGLHVAADRWEEAHGPNTAMAQAAPASCVSCGFLVPLSGSLRQAFGVCANEYSPADGQVVSLSYGCGGHSEAAVMPKPPQPPPPVIDETRADDFGLHDRPGEPSGTSEPSGPSGASEPSGPSGASGTETVPGETGGTDTGRGRSGSSDTTGNGEAARNGDSAEAKHTKPGNGKKTRKARRRGADR